MNMKIRSALKKISELLQKIIWGLVIITLALGWLAISGVNLYCATTLTCNSASLTWWSMFLSVFGLPILAVQMYLLRKTVEEGTWKPKISIGLVKIPQSPKEIMKLDTLPAQALIDFSDFIKPFQSLMYDESKGILDRNALKTRATERANQQLPKIVIRNTGKSAAKSIKIQIYLLEYPEQTIKPIIQFDKSKSLLDTDFLVKELEVLVHPGDYTDFIFSIMCDLARELSDTDKLIKTCFEYLGSKPEWEETNPKYPYRSWKNKDELITLSTALIFSEIFVVGKYLFEVKIWADGMIPVTEKLVLVVKDYSDELKTFLLNVASEASEYDKERREKNPVRRYIA